MRSEIGHTNSELEGFCGVIDVNIDVDLVQLVAEEVQEHEVQRSDKFFNANQDKHHNERIRLLHRHNRGYRLARIR